MKRAVAVSLLLFGLAQADAPTVVGEAQARADFFDYVLPGAQISGLRVYHGSDSGAGDPLVFTFSAGRDFAPQPVAGEVRAAPKAPFDVRWCARTGSAFTGGRLVSAEARTAGGRTGQRLTYQSGLTRCVIVTEADLFLTTVTRLPPEFTRYVTARPNQIRSLSIQGSDFQETRLVLQFRATGQVQFPKGSRLRTASQQEAQRFAADTECALPASRADELSLVTVPGATSVGRLMVRDSVGQDRNEYCVIVWNTDKS